MIALNAEATREWIVSVHATAASGTDVPKARHRPYAPAVLHQAANSDALVLRNGNLIQHQKRIRGCADSGVAVLEHSAARVADEVGVLHTGQRYDGFHFAEIDHLIILTDDLPQTRQQSERLQN